MRHHYFAKKNELLLDLDTEGAIEHYRKRLPQFVHKYKKLIEVPSESPGHLHVYIELEEPLEYLELIRCSQWLGSDIKRSHADESRLKAGSTKPMLLIRFRKPIKKWRKPDWTCECPINIRGEDGDWQRLRVCHHLRNYKPHKWKYGTLANKNY